MNFSELVKDNGLFCDGDWIEKKDQDPLGTIRLIQLADIGVGEFKDRSRKFVNQDTAERLNCTRLQRGDILIARLPDPLGRACIFPLDGDYITAVDVAVLRLSNNSKTTRKYIMHMINSPQIRAEIKKHESGTTRKRISRKNLDRIQFQLPTLAEQQRIVARIEELFSQLDSGVETLRKTKQQLAVYRQAIYSSVFNEFKSFARITDYFDISSGLTKNSARAGLPLKMPYLRVANVYYNQLDLNEIKYIGVKAEEVEKALLKAGDLLFVEGNGSKDQIGRVAIWDGSVENCLHQNHIIKGRAIGNMLPQFALYYLISAYGRKQILSVASSTSGLYTLSANKVRNLNVPVCTIEQQRQCIADIKGRLSNCDSIEQTVDADLQQAEALRQSILKKAFEGGV